jgi:hypothetical protein
MKGLLALGVAVVFVVSASAAGQSANATAKKTTNAEGTVKSVSASSLTINTGKQDMSFDIDSSTRVVAKGAGTKTAEAKQAGKGVAITDVVHEKDRVRVAYQDMGGGKLHASAVRVR